MQFLSQSLLPVLLIIAGASDTLSFRIPNWLTALTALLFFPMALLTHMPLNEMALHMAAGLALFVAGFIFFQLNIFGGGDAKLMAAAGLWFGLNQSLPFLVNTVIAGGVLALIVGIWSMIMLESDIHAPDFEFRGVVKRLRGLKPNVPYGLAFALGGILVFRDTWWMTGTV